MDSYVDQSRVNVLIKKHERIIEVLNAIKEFEHRIELNEGSINSYAGTFGNLKRKYEHRIKIQLSCINRLYSMYNKLNKNTL